MKNFIAQWLELWGEVINLEVLVYGKEEKEKNEAVTVYMFTHNRSQ